MTKSRAASNPIRQVSTMLRFFGQVCNTSRSLAKSNKKAHRVNGTGTLAWNASCDQRRCSTGWYGSDFISAYSYSYSVSHNPEYITSGIVVLS